MTPVEAIIKNILAIGLLIWLFKSTPSDGKSNLWVLTSIALGCILGLFMMAPMKVNTTPVVTLPNEVQNLGISTDTTLNIVMTTVEKAIDSSNNKATLKIDEPLAKKSGFANYFTGIDQDKKILCFFAPGCEHCQETAKELTEMKRKDKNFPAVSIIFMDEETDKIPDFFNVAGTKYPYQVVDIISFWNLIGNTRDTPGVKYLWNGNEILFYDGINANKFNGLELKKTLKKNYSELKK
jgi:thiol-disulfide isomerase/thioredoxin